MFAFLSALENLNLLTTLFRHSPQAPSPFDGGEKVPPPGPPQGRGGGGAPQKQALCHCRLLWEEPSCPQVFQALLLFFLLYPVPRSGKGAVLDEMLGRPVFYPETEEDLSAIEGYFDPDRDTVFLHMK